MTKHEKILLSIAGGLLFTGIILGALGAHTLKNILTFESLDSFKTGIFYQLTQSLGLILLLLVQKIFDVKLKSAIYLLLWGILLFSWSIYGLTLSNAFGTEFLTPILGPITPIGGLLMITGWLTFIVKVLKMKQNP